MLSLLIRNVFCHRYLLAQLVNQQVTALYRQSIFGMGWAVLQPLMYTALFLVLRGLVSIPSEGVPAPLFMLTAMMSWSAFSTAVTVASASIVLNAPLIRKIYFPRELFPAAACLTRWIDFGVGLLLVVALMAYYRTPVTIQILWVPFLLVLQTTLALAIGLITSSMGAFKRDIILGIPSLLQIGIYLSPIIYPLSAVPQKYRGLYLLNPLTGIVESYRRVILLGLPPQGGVLLASVVSTLVVLQGSYWIFKRLEMQFADVL